MCPLDEQHLLLHQINTKAFSSTLKRGLDMVGGNKSLVSSHLLAFYSLSFIRKKIKQHKAAFVLSRWAGERILTPCIYQSDVSIAIFSDEQKGCSCCWGRQNSSIKRELPHSCWKFKVKKVLFDAEMQIRFAVAKRSQSLAAASIK